MIVFFFISALINCGALVLRGNLYRRAGVFHPDLMPSRRCVASSVDSISEVVKDPHSAKTMMYRSVVGAGRKIGRCLSTFPKRDHIDTMSHATVYVVDTNLVECYKDKTIPAWNKFADEHVSQGKKFYMVELNFEEVRGPCPSLFEVVTTDQPITEEGMESFYKRVLDEFEVTEKMQAKLKKDIMAIGAAGFAVASAPEEQISINDLKADNVLFLTHNLKVLERLLGDENKTKLFEKLVDESGLEHLIAVRGIFNDGTFLNYW